MPSAEDDLAARIQSCLADTRESFENIGEDLLAEAAQALRNASVMAIIQEQGKQMAFDALRHERQYASQHLQRAYNAEAALREIVAATVPGDFPASSDWEIYQELARIRMSIARDALGES